MSTACPDGDAKPDSLAIAVPDEGASRSVAVFRHMVNSATNLEENTWHYSEPFIVQMLSWRIGFKVSNETQSATCVLGVYLCLEPCDISQNLVCCVEAELRLVSQQEGVQTLMKDLNKEISIRDPKPIGFEQLRFWYDVINPSIGFLKNNTIILEAYVAVTPPQPHLVLSDKKDISMLIVKKEGEELSLGACLAGLTLTDRAQSLLESEVGSDCEFLVGEEEPMTSFKASKVFLARASPVFERMFYGDLAMACCITIKDVEPDVFHLMLQYAYGCKWQFKSYEQAVKVFRLADRYWLNELKEACLKYLWPTDVCNLWLAIELATFYDLQILTEAVIKIVCDQTLSVFASKDFLEISQPGLVTILQQNTLNVTSETLVFSAAVKWAKAQCEQKGLPNDGAHQREQMGKAIAYIRFLTMTINEFVEIPSISGILTSEEIMDCVRAIVNKDKFLPSTTLCPLRKPRVKVVTKTSNTSSGYRF